MKRGPLKLFYSYAHEDESQRDRIEEHLDLLKRQNLIVGWHDRHIVPGTEWNKVIEDALVSADIIILLVSRAFMSSEYVNKVEIPEAMKVHKTGKIRVVPILLEKIPNLKKIPFYKLQFLPSGAKPISEWKDKVKAYRNIATGIRRVAKDIIVKGGGPFEFGPHIYMESELSGLPETVRRRTLGGLGKLRNDLNLKIPSRKYETNLLVATWALRDFGSPTYSFSKDLDMEALYYMSQVISSFDLVAIQKVDQNLQRLELLMKILGPDWKFLVTDVSPGNKHKRQRFAFLYYQPRVEFRNFSSQVVVPAKQIGGIAFPSEQFVRPPLIASFRSGGMDFQVCTAHIVFGGTSKKDFNRRLEEIKKLGTFLRKRSLSNNPDMLLLGDFQMGTKDSPILDTLRKNKIEIPDELLHPTNSTKTKYYDLIGFSSNKRSMPLNPRKPRSGAYDIFQHIFRDEDLTIYKRTNSFKDYIKNRKIFQSGKSTVKSPDLTSFKRWKTFLISNHLPLWAELKVEELKQPS